MHVAFVIEGVPIILEDDQSYTYVARAEIDDDGSGLSLNDPDFQPATTYRKYKTYLNAEVDLYIVVPPQIINAIPKVVMGCQAFVVNTLNGLWTPAVVGDEGPSTKIGEMAVATAIALGIPPSPTTGGLDTRSVLYRIFPGVPAVVNGVNYQLEAAA